MKSSENLIVSKQRGFRVMEAYGSAGHPLATMLATSFKDEELSFWKEWPAWTLYTRFVHREILPLAREKAIPVHIISRNLNGVLTDRALETLPRLIMDAKNLGFAGFNFYEVANLLEMNSEGVSFPKGLARPVVQKASGLMSN